MPKRSVCVTDQRFELAVFLAAQGVSIIESAAQCGVSPSTIDNWRAMPAFRAKVNAHIKAYERRLLSDGVTHKASRILGIKLRHEKLMTIVDERAILNKKNKKMRNVPGGTTGYVVMRKRALGSGATMLILEEVAIDEALIRELREHELHVARELGQLTDKVQHSGSVLIRQYAGVDTDKV